jgi:hypothetical protein
MGDSRALPTARNSAASVVIGDNWHIVGGRTVSGGNTPAHDVYDANEDRWRPAAPMPQGQGGLAAAALGGKLYAFGGEYFDNGGGVYPESWAYEPTTDRLDRAARYAASPARTGRCVSRGCDLSDWRRLARRRRSDLIFGRSL